MGAPTEAEIRAAIDEANPDFGELVYEFTRCVSYADPGTRGFAYEPRLYEDLRPSERERLEALLSEVYDLEEPVLKMIEDRVVAAVLTFAAEYPDAPRAIREAVAA